MEDHNLYLSFVRTTTNLEVAIHIKLPKLYLPKMVVHPKMLYGSNTSCGIKHLVEVINNGPESFPTIIIKHDKLFCCFKNPNYCINLCGFSALNVLFK